METIFQVYGVVGGLAMVMFLWGATLLVFKLAEIVCSANKSFDEEKARVEREHRLALAEQEGVLRLAMRRSIGRCGRRFADSGVLCSHCGFFPTGPWELKSLPVTMMAELVRRGADPDDSVFVFLDMCGGCSHVSLHFQKEGIPHRILEAFPSVFLDMEIYHVFEVGAEGGVPQEVFDGTFLVSKEGVVSYIAVCHPAIAEADLYTDTSPESAGFDDESFLTSGSAFARPRRMAKKDEGVVAAAKAYGGEGFMGPEGSVGVHPPEREVDEEEAREIAEGLCMQSDEGSLAERVGILSSNSAEKGRVTSEGELVYDFLASNGSGITRGDVSFPPDMAVEAGAICPDDVETPETPQFNSAFAFDDEEGKEVPPKVSRRNVFMSDLEGPDGGFVEVKEPAISRPYAWEKRVFPEGCS